MTSSTGSEIDNTLTSLQRIFTSDFCAPIDQVAARLTQAFRNGAKVMIMGNGGSAADAQHIAAELVGRYRIERQGLPAIALSTDTSILTAWSNDYSFDTVYSRQVEALARPGDIVWGISTSGNSTNVVRAFEAARSIGATTFGLLGRDGGELAALSDMSIIVPLTMTDQIQAAHLLIYHAVCSFIDEAFRPDRGAADA